jgi:hypothetical protein
VQAQRLNFVNKSVDEAMKTVETRKKSSRSNKEERNGDKGRKYSI